MAWTVLARSPPKDGVITSGLGSSGVLSIPEGAVIGTDGSGGTFGADPRLRRVGWVWVLLPERKTSAFAQGSVAGEQTVPRAELQAILHLLEFTTGEVTVHTDCLSVLNGVIKLQQGICEPKPDTTNGQMWRKAQLLLQTRKGSFRFEKIKAHLTREEALKEGFTKEAWIVDAEADSKANEAASETAYDQASIDRVKDTDRKANRVLGRLLKVHRHILENYEAPEREPRPKPKATRKVALEVGARHGHRLRIKGWHDVSSAESPREYGKLHMPSQKYAQDHPLWKGTTSGASEGYGTVKSAAGIPKVPLWRREG